MSCNGCRVLRKGCSENCMLRPCLQWIETAEAQGHATVFVAKFFGRAGLMSFISAVPGNQRPALFQSLFYEAAGRTVNPVNGAVGLLWSGNWHVCRAAVETVLRGGALRPIPEFLAGPPEMDEEASGCTTVMFDQLKEYSGLHSRSNKVQKRRRVHDEPGKVVTQLADLDLSLTPGFPNGTMSSAKVSSASPDEKRRLGSPSMNSQESGTTTCLEISGSRDQNRQQEKEPELLNLFN